MVECKIKLWSKNIGKSLIPRLAETKLCANGQRRRKPDRETTRLWAKTCPCDHLMVETHG